MQVRRRRICFVQIADQILPDFHALFRGEVKIDAKPKAELLCPIDGERIALKPEELPVLASLSAEEWVEAEALMSQGLADKALLVRMAERQVLLTDAPDDVASQRIMTAEKRMEDIGWYDLTAMYHAMTRWSNKTDDVSDREHSDAAHRSRLDEVAKRHGPPPTHFPRRDDAIATEPLDLPAFDSPLAEILKARRTARNFASHVPLPRHELSHMLYGTFGAMGTQEFAPGMVAVKRTSASGGGLTPMDAYPLIMNVEGLRTGIYHYEAGTHSLELLKEVPEQSLRAMVMQVTAGQDYFAQAQAAIVHVARFARHHWKYRRHAKAYKALLMDSAHLSQTFYLLATERGLGAFYTAALNDVELTPWLGLDPIEAAPVGMSGVGITTEDPHDELHFCPQPYDPTAARR
ncbi:putative peptide maturation dehydrogenase [Oleiagrimonas sp. C23AA]|uniref:putative peptide maturation dehydrogenase n=1 Tax=Oleiagrimonas sp. C23AA TaxID=2719047 RepID=UPI0014229B6C|nr:putative peptide maturation dehydrogenase [Oleiagrimonas sp. C23AA]NII10895.1 putative peptide maturation dehydrogenase [Oleiagrimonas sp. C23AA]